MRLLYNIFGLTGLLVAMMPMLAMQVKQKWLILGAGTKHDTPRWDTYAKEHQAEWIGFNHTPSLERAIEGDFNSPEDLEDKLTDNTYHKIFIDANTMHFVCWHVRHLVVLQKKLRAQAELLIRYTKMTTYGETRLWDRTEEWCKDCTYENYRKLWNSVIKKDSFITGLNWVGIKIDAEQCREFRARYEQEELHPYNLTLLRSIFGNNVHLNIENPYPEAPKDRIITYYSAIKAESGVTQNEDLDPETVH